MTVSFSRMLRSDLDEVAFLEGVLFPDDGWSREIIASEVTHPDSFYVTGRDAATGALIGYGGLRASTTVGGQGDIQTLAIAGAYRGRGLGRKILATLLEEAWARNVGEVFLEVRADNDAARRLYSRAGFHEIARRPGYYQPGSVDAIVMKKTGDPGEETT